jgi:NADPH:quinone reductase-like Zn-dependent oxidoreductase
MITLNAALIAVFSIVVATAADRPAGAMKAIVYDTYGTADVLRLEDVAVPVPEDDRVLIKVRAAAVNPLDWHTMRGTPYIMRLTGIRLTAPADTRLGTDVAGEVVAVGNAVTRFKPGDAVFGGATGAFAEYALTRERNLALKPESLAFEQAAAIPIAAVTALQGLRDAGQVKAGQHVLINGASGGVGTFAVQIAKAIGAEVTAVCSGRNAELVRGLGADHVIDYTREDFTLGAARFDVVFDVVGNRAFGAIARVMTPGGILVMSGAGGPDDGRWIGPFAGSIAAMAMAPLSGLSAEMLMVGMNAGDLAAVADLVAAGKVTPVIDRTYPLTAVPEAIRYVETGRARGKVIITVAP